MRKKARCHDEGEQCRSGRRTAFCKNDTEDHQENFLEMGAVMERVYLAIVLCVIFVLPQVISAFYYNPNQVMGRNEEAGTITTDRMSLDLAVYSEIFQPGIYQGTVNAVSGRLWSLQYLHSTGIFLRWEIYHSEWKVKTWKTDTL